MDETILDASYDDARRFFLEAKSYCNFDMPTYFDFQPLLWSLAGCPEIPDEVSGGKDSLLTSRFMNAKKEKVNYNLFINKDGRLSWRPLELINPIAYVYLVKLMTEKRAWEDIRKRFSEFQKDERIECQSIPLVKQNPNQKRTNIVNWYENFEKQSIKLSLEYKYMFSADILNCYSSIYTHSIAWALHPNGEKGAKNDRKVNKICNAIDCVIQQISYGQTDGIPQGSVLMDFIAEAVLGYGDLLLLEKINNDKNIKKNDFHIIRYRDDYKIFAKSKNVAEKIGRYLSEVLMHLNLHLNPDKTFLTENIVTDAQKSDKLFWRDAYKSKDLNTRVLQIHSLSEKYPNSGSVIKGLTDVYDMLEDTDNVNKTDLQLVASVVADIAYRNPRTYPMVIAILGKIFSNLSKKGQSELLKSVINKFEDVPNSEYFNIWLQRLCKQIPRKKLGESRLCDYIRECIKRKKTGGLDKIWDCSDLYIVPKQTSAKSTQSKKTSKSSKKPKSPKYTQIKKIMNDATIFDKRKYDSMPDYPSAEEVKVFGRYF